MSPLLRDENMDLYVKGLSNENKVVCSMIALMELAHVGSIADVLNFAVLSFQATYWTELTGIPENKRLVTACLSTSLCSDVVITLSICFYLHTSRTGYKSVGDVIVMATFLLFPNNVAFFAIFEITIELYANAVLTSLNTRTKLRERYASDSAGSNSNKYAPSARPMHHLELYSSPDSKGHSESPCSNLFDLEAKGQLAFPPNALLKTSMSE
ncbi:hypothetical protein SISNIDRAFT_530392 [Sistotremastrum niveocremeum HHB9708]|uniref:DUF6534 domain-containing protein n=1 Tax=Sistotremastrum niveocremeum HHB9708 TaxID=1314777 RepID=A0A164PHY4_9AGAM|nr:hypothetical protein SISNIDRAFT_530392 [Sistotremastrum niveocremeum HHB9708]